MSEIFLFDKDIIGMKMFGRLTGIKLVILVFQLFEKFSFIAFSAHLNNNCEPLFTKLCLELMFHQNLINQNYLSVLYTHPEEPKNVNLCQFRYKKKLRCPVISVNRSNT